MLNNLSEESKMENKIREYVARKFAVYPNTEKVIAFCEKLLSMMLDRYCDCRSKGMSEQKSYVMAISITNRYPGEGSCASMKASSVGKNGGEFCCLSEGRA
jgi:hypothetical protein